MFFLSLLRIMSAGEVVFKEVRFSFLMSAAQQQQQQSSSKFLIIIIQKVMNFLHSSTSALLALQAQDKLLKHFLRGTTFEVKSLPSNGMNYVVIKKQNHQQSSNSKPRTLVLMHGYGLGLGFFYGKSSNLLN
jgi:hypothetical protein